MRVFDVCATAFFAASLGCAHPILTAENATTQILDLEGQRQQAQLRGDAQGISCETETPPDGFAQSFVQDLTG